MDVAVVSCQECFFSKEAEALIRTFFDKLVTADKQKLDVALQSYDLKELDRTTVATSVHRAKVQIVIISHLFLQRLKQEACTRVRISPVNRVFRSKRVIAVLYGVGIKEISEGFEGVLARFSEWYCVELRSTSKLDPEFCVRFTDQVVKIYNVELSNTNNFSVFPKKVTKDQGKIVLTLKKPTAVGDEVLIEFTCGRRKEIMKNVRMENPFQTFIRVPVNLSPDKTALMEVLVYVNNQKLGATWLKYEAHTKYGDEDWIERMGNMVPGFYNLLDEHISQNLSKNFRECTDISTDPSMEIMNDVLVCKEDEFPTVLHFAAYYGLRLTAYTVLSEADGLEQCLVKNDMGESPLDVARMKGYENIVNMFGEYQYVNDSYKALKYIQDIIGRSSMPPSDADTLRVHKLNPKPSDGGRKQSSPNHLDYVNVMPSEDDSNYEHDDALSKINGNSDGSYVEIAKDFTTGETNSTQEVPNEAVDPMSSYDLPPTPVPVPRSKSPRRKSYVNISGSPTPTEASSTEVALASTCSSDDIGSQQVVSLRNKPRNAESSKRRSLDPTTYANIMVEDFSSGMPEYSTPRLPNQDYQIPPQEARPVYPEPHQSININDSISDDEENPTSPVLKQKKEIPTDSTGYWVIDPEEECQANSLPKSQSNSKQEDSTATASASHEMIVNERKPLDKSKRSIDVPFMDPCDVELIQLMEDFKRDGWSLQQVELLFEHWKSRPDVQESFELKKENLRKIREDYNKIKGKRTFFDKVVGIVLGRKRSQSHVVAPSPSMTSPSTTSPPPLLTDNFSPKFPESPILSRPHLRNLSKSRSTDLESETSQEGIHKSVSECGSDNAFDTKTGPIYSNALNKRFVDTGSYIQPDGINGSLVSSSSSLTSPSLKEKPFFVDPCKALYDQPPPPRPVESPTASSVSSGPPSPGPPIPHKPLPLKRGAQNGTNGSNLLVAPPIPEKPSHMRFNGGESDSSPNPVDEENPPPPPLRSYKPPNVFNYIDYKKKEK